MRHSSALTVKQKHTLNIIFTHCRQEELKGPTRKRCMIGRLFCGGTPTQRLPCCAAAAVPAVYPYLCPAAAHWSASLPEGSALPAPPGPNDRRWCPLKVNTRSCPLVTFREQTHCELPAPTCSSSLAGPSRLARPDDASSSSSSSTAATTAWPGVPRGRGCLALEASIAGGDCQPALALALPPPWLLPATHEKDECANFQHLGAHCMRGDIVKVNRTELR